MYIRTSYQIIAAPMSKLVMNKGQLISKGNFGLFKSTKTANIFSASKMGQFKEIKAHYHTN